MTQRKYVCIEDLRDQLKSEIDAVNVQIQDIQHQQQAMMNRLGQLNIAWSIFDEIFQRVAATEEPKVAPVVTQPSEPKQKPLKPKRAPSPTPENKPEPAATTPGKTPQLPISETIQGVLLECGPMALDGIVTLLEERHKGQFDRPQIRATLTGGKKDIFHVVDHDQRKRSVWGLVKEHLLKQDTPPEVQEKAVNRGKPGQVDEPDKIA